MYHLGIMINKKFGKTLSKIRQKKGLSQEALAHSLGLHRTYISQIERGLKSPSLKVIKKIASFFETSLTKFFSLVESEKL